MEGEKQRIINYRSFGLSAIIFVSTIFFVVGCFSSLWYILPLCLMFVGLTLYFGIKRSFGKLIFVIVTYVLIIASLMLNIFLYEDKSLDDNKHLVECRVDAIYATYENSTSVIASGISVSGNKKFGRILVTVYGDESIEIGDKITFESKVKGYKVLDIALNKANLYKNNIKYYASASSITIAKGNLTPSEKLKLKTKSNLISVMGERVGGLAYALLYGDRAMIETEIYDNFRQSGTAHLLAISGLHISLIISIVYFLISKIKTKNIVKFFIMFAFLFVYDYLCEFAVSVVRASIMGLTLIACKLFGKRYDSLSSLGLSLCIILLFSPLSLYDVGLLLSYAAVLAIILFSRTLDKVKFPNNIVRSVITTMFITTVVTIFTYPITANYFRTLPIYSVITNLVVIPLFTLGFGLLFVTNILALIGLKFLLYLPKIFFSIIIVITDFVANLPLATLKVGGISIGVCLLIYVGLFVISRFVMLKNKTKVVSCFVIFAVCVSIVVGNYCYSLTKCGVYTGNYSSSIIESGGKKYLVNPKLSRSYIYNLRSSLNSKDIYELDAIIFSPNTNAEVKMLQNFLEYFDAKVLVASSSLMIDNLKSSGVVYEVYDEGIALGGNVQVSVDSVDGIKFTKIVVNGTVFAFGAQKASSENFSALGYYIDYLETNKDISSPNIKHILNDEMYINCR